ncbi:MAG TPA: ATP-binding protein, partial [Thermoanaerobaculia bacterium]|nr:ATP-binding protein [Thermoanaerobaculia bacterium]
DLPTRSPVLSGDPVLLAHALRNLLTNAEAAQRRNRSDLPIEVSVESSEEGGWQVAIRDRGPGLPPKVRENLFQPFVSGETSGVGLGLALAYRIIDLHGGRLRLAAREGGGTEALILLPSVIFE